MTTILSIDDTAMCNRINNCDNITTTLRRSYDNILRRYYWDGHTKLVGCPGCWRGGEAPNPSLDYYTPGGVKGPGSSSQLWIFYKMLRGKLVASRVSRHWVRSDRLTQVKLECRYLVEEPRC